MSFRISSRISSGGQPLQGTPAFSLLAHVPGALHPLVSSPLVLGTVTAIGLNLLFRLGVRQKVTLAVNPLEPYAKEVEDFLDRQGAAWGARPDIVARAVFGINQSVEIVAEHGNVDTFQMADVAMPKDLFTDILRRIDRLRPLSLPT